MVLAARHECHAGTAAGLADTHYMAAGVRRSGPPCACCALSVLLRAEIAKRARNGDSLNGVSTWLVSEGHGIGRAGVTNHVRKCLAIAEPDGSDPATRSVLLADAVARLLPGGWAGRLDLIAHAANDVGLTTEALVLQASVPETMRQALTATENTPAHSLVAARALALACARVLRLDQHSAAARDIAADLAEQGAEQLAVELLAFASKPTARAEDAPTDRQPEGVACSPPAAELPPVAAQPQEIA